jgi:hypothetical protein
MDLHEILYGHYATEGHPELLLFCIFGNTNMAYKQTCKVGFTPVPLTIGSYNAVYGYLRNTQISCSNSLECINVKKKIDGDCMKLKSFLT